MIFSIDLMKKTKSAGGVVLNGAGEVLVVSQHGTSWSLPKGHIDDGETAEEAARREIFEEAGVGELTLVRPLRTYERFRIGKNGGEDKTEWKEIEMFLFETAEIALKPRDPENPEARWVAKERVVKLLTHQKDKEFFERVLKSGVLSV
ncbi:MAG: NUDIX family hydrolase [Parcubacteria group bacterium Gr01-1014_72]|nr:MAG: NUDIX family hydrolase [Parcubacteria group bacterium Gr01-1014_72]